MISSSSKRVKNKKYTRVCNPAQPHPPFLRIDLSFVVQLLAPILASLPPRPHREIPIFSHHSHSSSAHSPMTQPAHVHTFVPRTPDLAWFAAQLRHISRAPSSRYPTPLALFLSCPYVTVSRVKSLFPNCNISKRLNLLFLLFLCSFVCLLL